MNSFLIYKIKELLNVLTNCHNVRRLHSLFYQRKPCSSLWRLLSARFERTGFVVNSEGQIFPFLLNQCGEQILELMLQIYGIAPI